MKEDIVVSKSTLKIPMDIATATKAMIEVLGLPDLQYTSIQVTIDIHKGVQVKTEFHLN